MSNYSTIIDFLALLYVAYVSIITIFFNQHLQQPLSLIHVRINQVKYFYNIGQQDNDGSNALLWIILPLGFVGLVKDWYVSDTILPSLWQLTSLKERKD